MVLTKNSSAIRLILALMLIVAFGEVHAQMSRGKIRRNNIKMYTFKGFKKTFKQNEYTMVGVTLNALNYYGDLAPGQARASTNLSLTRPALGLLIAHRFGPRYTLTGTFTYGGIRGSDFESQDPSDEIDAGRYYRNASFRNRIKELAVVASMDLWDNQNTYLTRLDWTPYAFAGVSVFHHNPMAKAPQFGLDGKELKEAGEWVHLRRLGTEGQNGNLRETDVNYGLKPYNTVQIAIPFGLGVRWKLNQLMDLSVEFASRVTFTDYLDDVSNNYVDLGTFGDNELAKAMSYRTNELPGVAGRTISYIGADGKTYNVLPGYGQEDPDNIRGNNKDNDTFIMTTVKLTYIIGKSFIRAKFR